MKASSQARFGAHRLGLRLRAGVGGVCVVKADVVVMGATGRVGSLVVPQLLEQGLSVRAVGRGPGLEKFERLGAQVAAGRISDPAFVRSALRGAKSAFLLTPVDISASDVNDVQFRIVDAAAAAVAKSDVKHVVLLSSWGAELTQPVGGIIACNRFEEALNAIAGLNCVHLRPVWFMDNFLWSIPLIQMAGFNGSTIDPAFSFPMIAARDIAPIAAAYLSKLEFAGKRVRYLSGPKDNTLVEVTRALGEAIGNPKLGYVHMPQDVYRKGLLGGGLTPNAAEFALEIGRAINEGVVRGPPRGDDETTPTSIAQFAREVFAPAFRSAAPVGLGSKFAGMGLRAYLGIRGRRPVVS